MNKISDFLDRNIYAIIAAITGYIVIFVYLNLETYQETVKIGTFFEGAQIEIPKEEMIEMDKNSIEVPSDYSARDIKNLGRDVDDKRERTKDDWSENKMSAADVEKSVKDYEKKLFEEAGGDAQRKKIIQEMNDRKNQKNDNSSAKQSPTSTTGGNKAYSGDVMVEWDVRAPHQNNSWFVRNPGYTCGYGSAGKVTVRVKVNQNGDVVTAEYDASHSKNANSCMIEQATKYAKMSRFIYSGSAPKLQDGWISYTFISQ